MSRSSSIFSNASFVFSFIVLVSGIFVVDRIPLRWRFMWPLSIAGAESGRCLRTDSAVRPGHVVK